MKKIFVWLVVIALVVTIAFIGIACKASTTTTTTAAAETTAVATTAAAETTATPATTAAAAKSYTIGYLLPNTAEGQIMFMESFRRYAEKEGMKVIDVNADSKVENQDKQVTDLISQKVNALVMTPVDSQAIVAAVDRASEAGIPVFGIDRQPFSPKVIMTVMSNNYIAGQQAAQFMVSKLTEKYGEPKGTVLEVTGDLATNVAQLRGGGFNDEMKKYPNIKIITEPTDWSPEKGSKVVQNALAANPDIDGIFWHSGYTGAGVIAGIKEIGLLKPVGEKGHIIISGIDGDSNELNNIRQGFQDGTANQPLLDFGILAIYVRKYLDGEKLTTGTYEQAGAKWSPATIEETDYGLTMQLSTWLVTKENVDDPSLWGNYKPSK